MAHDSQPHRTEEVWSWIEGERRGDARLRRVSLAAWSTMFVAVLVYCAAGLLRLALGVREMIAAGASPFDASTLYMMAEQVVPLVVAVGVFSGLVAAFTTVGVFLRFRTASLGEIQMRLAALEQLMTAGGDPLEDSPAERGS